MAFVIADKVINEVCEAVGVDPMRCQRVIIDLQVQHIPLVYVQMIGDDSLLTVTPPVAEMAKIVYGNSPKSEPGENV